MPESMADAAAPLSPASADNPCAEGRSVPEATPTPANTQNATEDIPDTQATDDNKDKKLILALCFAASYQNYCLRFMPLGWITTKLNPDFLTKYLILTRKQSQSYLMILAIVFCFLPLLYRRSHKGSLDVNSAIREMLFGIWIPLIVFAIWLAIKFLGVKLLETIPTLGPIFFFPFQMQLVKLGERFLPSAFYCGIGDLFNGQPAKKVFYTMGRVDLLRLEQNKTEGLLSRLRRCLRAHACCFEFADVLRIGPADNLLLLFLLTGISFFIFVQEGLVQGCAVGFGFAYAFFKAADLIYSQLYPFKALVKSALITSRFELNPNNLVHPFTGQPMEEHINDAINAVYNRYKEAYKNEDIAEKIKKDGKDVLQTLVDFIKDAKTQNRLERAESCFWVLFKASKALSVTKEALYVFGLMDMQAVLTAYFDKDLIPYTTKAEGDSEVTLNIINGKLGIKYGEDGIVLKVSNKEAKEKGISILSRIKQVRVPGDDPFTRGKFSKKRLSKLEKEKRDFVVVVELLKPALVGTSFLINTVCISPPSRTAGYKATVCKRQTVWKILEIENKRNQATFEPGAMGLEYDASGIVIEVNRDGQAFDKGVVEEDQILKVGTDFFSPDAVRSAEASGVQYEVTFKVSGDAKIQERGLQELV